MPPVTPPPPGLSIISVKILHAYVAWHRHTKHIPKIIRYSLGVEIEKVFAGLIRASTQAHFSAGRGRISHIEEAITSNDVLKFMLSVLQELGGIDEENFILLSTTLVEVGRLLYGWKRKLETKNPLTV